MTKRDNTHLKVNSQEISLINFHQTLTLDIQYHVYDIHKTYQSIDKVNFPPQMFEMSLCVKSILFLAYQEFTIEAKDFNQINYTFI